MLGVCSIVHRHVLCSYTSAMTMIQLFAAMKHQSLQGLTYVYHVMFVC